MTKIRSSMLFAALCLAAASAFSAPYSMLEAFRQTAAKVNGMSNIYTSVAILVESTNPAVAPTDIVATIHAKQGPQTLKVGVGGVLRIPNNPALSREDPDVTLNQPKGTVNIRLQPFVRAPIVQASTLDIVGKMASEYNKAKETAPLLARTYRVPVRFVRLVPKPGNTLAATTSCGVVFAPGPGGTVQTPMRSFPAGCALKVDGQANRIELVFAQ